MSYWGRAVIGILMIAGGIASGASGLYGLLLTGTCASGGPFEIAHPCPDSTGLRMLLLTGGIVVVLVGVLVFAMRRFDGERAAIGIPAWCLGFGALSVTFLYAGFGPDAPDDDPGWRVFNGLMGGFFSLFVIAPLVFGRFARGRRERGERLKRDGRRAVAVVTAVHDTGVTFNDDPRVRVTLEVRPGGEAPFTAETTAVVSRVAIPRPGDQATVWYDPADRERLAVSFGASGDVDTALGAKPGVAPEPEPAPRAGDGPNLADELAKLGDLRTRGLLTDEEFAKAKDRLLGGS